MAKVGSHGGDNDLAAQTELFTYWRANAGIEIAPKMEKRRDSRPPLLSFAHERLWFLDQLQPGSAAHNICKAHRLVGPLDIAALSRALRGVVGRHETLRTCFRHDDGFPVQVVSESAMPTIAVHDVSALGEPSAVAEVGRLISEEARRPFDLADEPLLRMSVIKRGTADHVVLLTIHQMVFDGWSIGLFFTELASMYDAEISGRPVNLPSLPVQYADYAHWQRQRLQGDALRSQLTYWKLRLDGALPILSLPTTCSRPLVQAHRGARRTLSVEEPTMKGLLDVARRAKATLFETLMAAFNVLLYRYSGQSDIIVGFPVANRERTEIRDLIGFFVNTLALRTQLSDDLTYAELLRRVRAGCRDAMKHGELPFEKLVEELRLERDLSRNPIFQVMFAYQNEAPPILQLAGLRTEAIDTDTGAAKFDLTLSLMRTPDELIGFFEYDNALFDAPCIERMAGHWQTLLDGIVLDPNLPVSKLPLLTAAERRQFLIEWNRTEVDSAEDLCVHELFETQVTRSPGARAVEFDGEWLSYRELNRRANRLARHLRSLGVGPESRVGLCVERSLDMMVGLLAILKAGGAYVPLDPAYPMERIAFMLRDAQISVLLARKILAEDRRWKIKDGDSRSSVFDPRMKVVYLDGDARVIERRGPENLNVNTKPENLAYVIYTSGSTGEPKGVAIEHHNAAALLRWAKNIFSLEELAGVFASTSICFDLSVFEIFVPLCWGGTVILGENALQLSSNRGRDRITLVNMVPSVMREVIAMHGLPASVRTVNLAGEPLGEDLVRRLYEIKTVQKVYDLYGPSETTTYSTFTLRSPGSRATIGHPIENTRVYILDTNLQPAPVGVHGEIFIGGAGVARGYLNRPELTREKFLPDPFANDKRARIYRTGDFGRYLPDGNIEYLGRADYQVKIRGCRIELGEIEAALNRHPAVSQSIVVAREKEFREPISSDPTAAKQLIAYLVSDGGAPLPVGDLRSFLSEKLPEFMLPEVFIELDELPRNPNGKVDRNALPAPDGKPQLSNNFVAPRTEVEELVAQAWREALEAHQVGAHDNFFALGGHSLLATRVIARLGEIFGMDLPLRKLFELPTIASLTRHIERLRQNWNGAAASPIVPVGLHEKAPLSFAQRRLWFLHQLDAEMTAYNMPGAYRIKGALNIGALETAFSEITKRHDSLRTAIVEIDGQPLQRILPASEISIPVVDLTSYSATEVEAEIERHLDQEARHLFDLQSAPLMRVTLLRLAVDEHVLLVNFHHMICDGSSLVIFYRELGVLYEALLNGRPHGLPRIPLRYVDFAVWQENWLQQAAAEAQLNYWQRQLGNLAGQHDLATDYERPAVQSYRGARSTYRLPAGLTDGLKKLSQRQGVTLFMTLLATLKILLAGLTGQKDIVVGSTIAGRSRPELGGVIGFFINALALRTDLSGTPTFIELLGRVRAVCLDAYTHQDLPFDRIVEKINPQRQFGGNPIFQVLFNMAEVGERGLKLTGCETGKIGHSIPGAKFDLVIQAPEIDGCIQLTMVYNADLFTDARIAAMLEQFGFLLEQVAAEPSQIIDGYSLLSPRSKEVLPDPTAKLDRAWLGTIQEFVSRRAEVRSDAAAVVDVNQNWTYGHLDRLSSRLANYLIAKGVRPKDPVAIYAHRDATLALALLGILKAGGLFVILDPAYPPARLTEYLRIARPKVLLEMEGAGRLPNQELVSWLGASKNRRRMNLPRAKDSIGRILVGFSDLSPEVLLNADDPAYIAFTSGSAGQPKGVLCRHGPITHFLPWQEDTFGLQDFDRYALLSGLAYNHMHREIFTALASGATLYVPTSDCLREPEQLVDWLREQKITILHLTPALARLLCGGTIKKLPAVRRIFLGGDLLTAADVSAIRKLAPNAKMVSFYGATETQRAVGYYAIADERVAAKSNARQIMPAGRGVQDVQLLLLTAGGRLAGVGEVGELYVRSPHLAAGYVDDDTLTTGAFVGNPFTGRADDILYRTGELGRYLPDGNVEWIGRQDRRVSIRGFRIELAEVETALHRYPGVRNAAVVSQEFPSGEAASSNTDQRVVAYVETGPKAPLNVNELREFLRARLPYYMVPGYFQVMERLPLNSNGKVDYHGLPSLDMSLLGGERIFEAPQGPLEQQLGEVLGGLLGIERVSRLDSFFDLGGHSLLAAQAAARIRDLFHVRLDVRAFMESTTVEALAKRIEMMRTIAGETAAPNREREEFDL